MGAQIFIQPKNTLELGYLGFKSLNNEIQIQIFLRTVYLGKE